jgi:uncharacterized metal-binding protein
VDAAVACSSAVSVGQISSSVSSSLAENAVEALCTGLQAAPAGN